MDAWLISLGLIIVLGISAVLYWRRKLIRRQREDPPNAVSGPLADLDAWFQEQSRKPEMIPWYGWRKELRLALSQEDGLAGLVVIAIVLALAGYGLWSLLR